MNPSLNQLIEYVFAHKEDQNKRAFAYSVTRSKILEDRGFDMIGTRAIKL